MRTRDVTSAGLIRAKASKYAPPANTEELLELNYEWNHSRFLTVTPHAQYPLEARESQWSNRNRAGDSVIHIALRYLAKFGPDEHDLFMFPLQFFYVSEHSIENTGRLRSPAF